MKYFVKFLCKYDIVNTHIFKFFLFFIVIGLSFISKAQFFQNKGQLDPQIYYTKPIFSGSLLVSENGLNYLFYDDQHLQKLYEISHHLKDLPEEELKRKKSNVSAGLKMKYHNIAQEFIGAKIIKANILEEKAQESYYNYFIGNDPEKWASDVKAFYTLRIKDLYPGIDLELLSSGLELKYNFICHPGSNPQSIKIKYSGAEALSLVDNKLSIKTSLFDYSETIPVSYIISGVGEQTNVPVKMALNGNVLSFVNIPEASTRNGQSLVIDPKLVFSTYSGSSADNFGFTATYDEQGNLYAGGITTSAVTRIPYGRYPTTVGAFDATFNGGDSTDQIYPFPCDITISKYSSDGSRLLYATYIGGDNNEFPHSLVVDKQNNLVILGSSFSFNYPVTNTAFSPLKSVDADIVITKLTPTGNALIGSTFYGGAENDGLNESFNTKYFYADNFRGDIICDDDGSILGAISTFSNDIPLKNGFKNLKTANVQQGVVFKFSPNLSSLKWSTYVGGDGNSAIYSIDLDKDKNIFVSGGINGGGLGATSGTIHENFLGGRADGFIAQIASDGSSLIRATYYGSDKYDQIISLEIDNGGRVFVVGQTEGVVPIKGNVYNNGKSGQFVSILEPDLSEIILSTTFGTGDGWPDITLNAFMVDDCKRTFISGWGGLASGKYFSSTKSMPVTSDAIQKTTDGSDFYILVLGNQFKDLTYATYFGGNRTNDHVDGGTSRWDKKGVIYQSVCSSCPQGYDIGPISDFPTTKGAFAELNISPRCSNAAFKFAVENLNLRPQLKDTFFEVMAYDTLTFDYLISDPDEDTIDVNFQKISNFITPFLSFPQNLQGIAQVTSNFEWSPKCPELGTDTFYMQAKVSDRGCPDFKSNEATIKIKVLPPPVIPPPETVCLFFKDNDFLEISWTAIPYSKHYKYTVLYKTFPNGGTVAIDTIRSISAGKYLDKNVVDPRNNNYVYYLKVVNVCDEEGPMTYLVSSIQEILSPITVTTLVTATVINNKDVAVHWLPSKEPDFGSYSIYRSKNTPTLNFQYLKTIGQRMDTTFVDKSYDVQSESYCYAIVVHDNCGKSSVKSNIGCNIVLKGESKPFYHVLDWPDYREWSEGISEFVLERSVDTGILRPIVSTLANSSQKNNYSDHNLDYDWGGYWYSVVAKESFKGLSAQSRSNSIYLIQPPLLHVPNAFTKNRDGLNETWGFVPVFVKTYHMQVFNRWGEKVFDSENKKEDWDGNYLEQTKGSEVFIWQVTYTGWDKSRHYQKGTVTVVK